jgi:ABC-type branched-subunit amino acid transport system substrate-binding protein
MGSSVGRTAIAVLSVVAMLAGRASFAAEPVKVGLNYPKTGPYATQGLDQYRAATMALDEINAAGGILGRPVELVWRDSQSKVDVTKKNVTELIDAEGVKMLFGGSASSVAIAAGEIAQQRGVPFFGTLTYSTDTTGKDGHRFVFRECYDSWMAAKALSLYMTTKFAGKRYFYVTSDYTWGWTTERAMRALTQTTDEKLHQRTLTPFPTATAADFRAALEKARAAAPDVLVLVLFGQDMVQAIKMAHESGLKARVQIVVPNLTLGMAEDAGPAAMEGVVGALPWAWNIPYKYDFEGGKRFVEAFARRYGRYPCTSGASAYTILWEYKAAVERAGTFDGAAVVRALEGHAYERLKGRQYWRDFDHQSVQTVYAVRCKPAAEVVRDKYRQDYFQILGAMPGDEAAIGPVQWRALRTAAGKPPFLEKLPGE